jgi:hypothetical protein
MDNRFAKRESLDFYYNAHSVQDAVDYLLIYQPKEYAMKWY